jgi:hypothetical protein
MPVTVLRFGRQVALHGLVPRPSMKSLPRGDRPHNRLAPRMDVNVLDGHLLLTFAAMAVERLYEGHARTALPEAAASSKSMRGISSGLSTRASPLESRLP